jgi:hypothetical protein
MRRPLLILLLILLLAGIHLPRVAAQSGEEADLLGRLNALRAQNGLGALAWNGMLAAAALNQSQYLSTAPFTDAHVQANGSTPQDRARAQGYTGRVSENVVGGAKPDASYAWTWWMNSAVHRGNMLGNWNEVGIAVAEGPRGRWYTMVFGNNGQPVPQPVSAQPATGGGQPANASAPTRPRPTQPPTATFTPSITLTPSQTFTPRPTFTPTITRTAAPPTETPILLEVSPPPNGSAVPATSTTLPAPTAVAVIATEGAPTTIPASAPSVTTAPPSNPLRVLIPVLLAVNVLIIGVFFVRNLLRRR